MLSEVSGLFKLRRERQQRRDEFQRETILAVQESLAGLSRASSRVHIETVHAANTIGVWQILPETDPWAEQERDAQQRVAVLAPRLEYEDLRAKVDRMRDAAHALVKAPDSVTAHERLTEQAMMFTPLNEALGERLRAIP